MSESAEELAVDAPVALFRADPSFPLKVTYCGECSLPMEYCEFMPQAAKCRQWWERNFPSEFAKLGLGSTLPSKEVGCVGCVDGEGAAEAFEGVEEEEKKRQKRGVCACLLEKYICMRAL
uniref:DENR N-terminal domain-containing protein n=1 Tax=Eptatretus burgeri TaxID=7764 RepID=A0A8C4R5T0_EPTBU